MTKPTRSTASYIDDMLTSIKRIRDYSAQKDSTESAVEHQMIDDAIERQFIELGEAAHHLPTILTDQFPDISWRDIAGMRNLITHEYWGVDADQINRAISEDFPTVEQALLQMSELNQRIETVTSEFKKRH
jgi:uncharacterized protein with HEPN domain